MTQARMPNASPQRHKGVSLLIVMVILLLTTLLAIGGARTALLNESLTGNLTDQQRAFTAAEALLREAQDSVMLHLQQSNAARAANFLPNSTGQSFLPQSALQYSQFVEALENGGENDIPCVGGYCSFPPSPAQAVGDWWDKPTTLSDMWDSGASYGQYTGNTVPTGNTTLRNGRFWVEVYQYSKSVSSQARAPDDAHPFVYQLTSVVRGIKPGTQVVLRSIIVPTPVE
jgi:type IV pilus assembly protein PilX